MSIGQLFDAPSKTAINISGQSLPPGKNGIVEFDYTGNFSHTKRARITSLPVEDGSIINDHIIKDPDEFSLSCEVSRTPISLIPFGDIAGAIDDLLGGNTAMDDPVTHAIETLTWMADSQIAVDVYTNLKQFQGYKLTNFGYTKGIDTGKAVEISLSFKKVNIIDLDATGGGTADVTEVGTEEEAAAGKVP